ncbi:MAG: glycerol-3-phosphate dehydrogenase/oxidase [Pseudomonadales bacterium]|nr:glycerol-3-phosphate dehydrogenase/oxidase [Pseudomonadales bacterium]
MDGGLNGALRNQSLATLESQQFDIVVVGGGITGAGILRLASLQGLSVALVEAEDFAAGTSSKSTKLIHGGLRYLAMGHLHVVRRAVLERKRIHQLAAHLAEPKWLLVPVANRIEHSKFRLGISLYERLGKVDKAERHFNLSGGALAEHEPLLNQKNYPDACIYREYLTDDARLVLANIRAGVYAGGVAVNRLQVTGLLKQQNKISAIRARCKVSGEEVIVRGRLIINAAGPWIEKICQLDDSALPKAMVLSKGVHITVPLEKLPIKQMVFTTACDGRPVFMIPRGKVVFIGTTDGLYPAAAEIWPVVFRHEVDYLLQPLEQYFGVKLNSEDCLTSWAGLRPLIHQPGKSTQQISRRDELWLSKSGLLTIAGGKLTGYRLMAESAVGMACKLLGRVVSKVADDYLPGGDFAGTVGQLSIKLARWFSLTAVQSERLVRLYGAEAEAVIKRGDKSVIGGGDILLGEILWAIETEAALGIEDVLYRRTRVAVYQPQEAAKLIEPVSAIMAAKLGWDEQRRTNEVKMIQQRMSTDGCFA